MEQQKLAFPEYLELCQRLLLNGEQELERTDALIVDYLSEPNNFEQLKFVFEGQREAHLKLLTLKYLTKSLVGLCSSVPNDFDTRSRNFEDLDNKEYLYFKLVMDYFVYYLSLKKAEDPVFIVNSICDLYGTLLRNMVAHQMNLPQVEDLEKTFFNPNSAADDIRVGLKLFSYCLTNLVVNTGDYGYFRFRKMVYSFQSRYLFDFLNIARRVTKFIWASAKSQAQPGLNDLMKAAFDVVYKCLTFPFSLSYFDFNSDFQVSDITITIFPEDFSQTLTDMEFFDCFFELFFTNNAELKLTALRILAKIASTRLSIFEEKTREEYRCKLISGFVILVQNSPLDNLDFCTELIDYALKIMFVFGQGTVRNNPHFPGFMDAAQFLSNEATKVCTQLDNPLVGRLFELWNKLEYIGSQSGPDWKSQLLSSFIDNYCAFHISQSDSATFFTDNVKSSKKFLKLVNTRFEVFRDFTKKRPEVATQIFANAALVLEQLEASCLSMQCDSGLFVSKFTHFLIFFSKACLKVDFGCTDFNNYSEDFEANRSENEQLVHGRVADMCCFVFRVMKNAKGFVASLKYDTLIGFEMSLLFFLETFMMAAMDKSKVAEESALLIVADEVYLETMAKLGMAGGFEEFFDLMTNKVLSNFDYRHFHLSEYSISVLRNLVEKNKKLFKGKTRDNLVIDGFSRKLQNINFSILSERKFYELRSRLFETIALSYLDDSYDDYINNSHTIFERVISTNTANGEVDLMRVFFDLMGVYKGISLQKIIMAFTRISYPKVQELLQRYAAQGLSDPAFVCSLLDFYNVIIDNTSQRYSSSQCHSIVYKVLTDACQIVSVFLVDLNKSIAGLKKTEDIVKFLEGHLKLVKKLFRIFRVINKSSDISFSVFYFFGFTVFLDFFKSIHRFLALTVFHITAFFPSKAELLLECFKESVTHLSDFMAEHFTAEELHEVLVTLHTFFVKKSETLVDNSETKTLQDESSVGTVQTITTTICVSLHETFCINRNEESFSSKMQHLMVIAKPTVCNFVASIVEFCLKVHLSSHVSNCIADMVFHMLCLFDALSVLKFLVDKIRSDMNIQENSLKWKRLMNLFEDITKGVFFRLDLIEKEKFHDLFRELIKGLWGLPKFEFN
jgi:hypothetical protein